MIDEDRKTPEKIRVTKLQEAQLLDLQAIEARCAQMFYEVGFSDQQVKPRNDVEVVSLTRGHDVLVAEADHQPAGYLAWADQAPGIAYLPILMVGPAFQRFGIATRLLRELGEVAANHDIKVAVTPVWERAPWALSFLGVRGFQPLDGGNLPDKLSQWHEMQPADKLPAGQKLWWASTDGLGTIPGLPRPA